MEHLLQAKQHLTILLVLQILIVRKTPFLEKSGKGVFCWGLKRQEKRQED